MVSFHISYTAPINPVGSPPTLTRSQVWDGLQRKIRFAQDFVPTIVGCEVVSQTGDDEVVREIEFKPGFGPGGKVREVCRSFEPSWVDFVQPDGSTVKNVISDGADGALYLTYVFEWKHPDMEAGSQEAKEAEEKHRKVAKMAVESSIDYIRKL